MPAYLFWNRLPLSIYEAIGKKEINYLLYKKIIGNGIIERDHALIWDIVSH